MIIFLIALAALVVAFSVLNMSVQAWLILTSVVMAFGLLTGLTNALLSIILLLITVPLLLTLYYAPALRQKFVTGPLYRMVKRTMPPISQTEQEAIDAGTVWWDAELFAGKPDWSKLMSLPKPQLNAEEREFIEGPVEELCEMSDDWDISHTRNDLPPEVWQYIKDQRFFALNASKDFGGLGFSAYAQSCIVQKLSTRSSTTAC